MSRDAEIAAAQCHIADGELHIDRQREIIAQLRASGADTTLAEQVLNTFEATMVLHVDHLERLRRG